MVRESCCLEQDRSVRRPVNAPPMKRTDAALRDRPEDWRLPALEEQEYRELTAAGGAAHSRRTEQDTPLPDTGDSSPDWSIRLVDAAQGSNSRTAALCRAAAQLLCERVPAAAVLWAPVAPVQESLLGSAELLFRVCVPWLPEPLLYRSQLHWRVQELLEAVLLTLDQSAADAPLYLLKLCSSDQFLRSDEVLAYHECIQAYHRFSADVPVRLVLRDSIGKTLSPDEEDHKQSLHYSQVLQSASNHIRWSLQEKLDVYSSAVTRLMRNPTGEGVCVLLDSAVGVCAQLCVSTVEMEEAAGRLKSFTKLTLDHSGDLHTAVVALHRSLLKLLQIFFRSFDLDFSVWGTHTHSHTPPSDVQNHRGVLQLSLTSLHTLQPGWRNGYDHLRMSVSVTHSGRNLAEPVQCENISTSLQLHGRIHCNRQLVFPLAVRDLPYESVLCFSLLGCKQGRCADPLCWAVLPLFSDRTLAHGTLLLSMNTQETNNCPASAALSDTHRQPSGVILQVDFPDSELWRYERVLADTRSVQQWSVCEELESRIRAVCQKHCVSLMSENEKAFLWSKRQSCSYRNALLHLLLGSAPLWAPRDLPELYAVLEPWGPVSHAEALFLISHQFHDQRVRSAAVQCFQQMSDSELEEFLPQLVQALKSEWEIDGPLVKLLLSRSMSSVRIAHQLYWLLLDALQDTLFSSFLSKVVCVLKHCCGRALRLELQQEQRLLDLLTLLAQSVRTADRPKRKELLMRERWKLASFFADGVSCRLPLDPALLLRGVNTEAFKVFNSNAAPIEVSFITADPLGQNYSIICKTGDNLRQDMLVLQIVRVLDRMWKQEGLDMRMVTYRCISTGPDRGLVEVVGDAVTLAQIHQEWGLSGALREDTLEKWFHMRNKTKEDYEKAVMNFLHSCAGWCVATFVLGICDRHNDNIMLTHSGHMFHIDFGKIMGNAQKFGSIKRDRTPFIFTPEMQRFITGGGENPQRFHRFVELCCDAYNRLRRHTALLLALLQPMLNAGMPEMKDVQDLQYVHNNLRPEDSELEATSYFTRKIKESMESLPVKLNFLIHNMVQLSSKRPEGLSQSQTSSSNNIQQAEIQKYTVKGKDVTYELKVTIEDGFVISQKSFSQLESLHKLLQKHFIESTLPKFPSWFNMSFTPGRKMTLLNKYLKELFEGPCRGNEYVCSLFLDGPDADLRSETNAQIRPQIQLFLSYKDQKLSVLIKHLKNIRLSNGSCPDAYVVTRLRPDPHEKTKRKTKAVRNNDHPTFNELIEYRNVLKLHGLVLEVTVKSRKAFVAATNVVLGERVLEQEKWFPLGFSEV